jgi:dinuclear metal center YbgI/SA1388 family protein
MTTIRDIYEFLDNWAPFSIQESYDRAGFTVGRGGAAVKTVIVSLDVTLAVIEEAAAEKADLIVSHHPLFFPPKEINDGSAAGEKLLKLAENGIGLIAAHTNMDAAEGGVNDVLAKLIGISEPELLYTAGYFDDGRPYCIGRYGQIGAETPFEEYLQTVKSNLNANGLRYYNAGKPVKNVAVVGGSGGDLMEKAAAVGCDTFVTGDVKYNVFLDAAERGINLIDAGHYCTENPIVPVIAEKIRKNFSDVTVRAAGRGRQIIEFI